MHHTSRFLAAFATSFVLLLWVASGASAETLGQALAAAWNNNPSMGAARLNASAARTDVDTAQAGWYPKLSLRGQLAHTHTDGTIAMFGAPSDFDANLDQASIALRLQQPIYEGGRLSAHIAASKNAAQAGQARTGARGAQVLLNAVTAYVDVVAAQQLMHIQNDNVDVIKRQLQAAQTALRHGEGTNTDVAQASSRLQAALAQRIRTQSELAQAKARYRQVIGHAPSALVMPTAVADLPPTLDRAKALAAHNDAVRAARYSARSASKRADVADAAVMPKVDLFAQVSRANEPQFGFEEMNDATIGLTVSIPIWNGGALRSKATAAQQRARAAMLKADAARDQARQQVISAWHEYAAAGAALGAEQARLDAAHTAATGVAAQHKYGERTLIDVLDAQQEVRNARAAVTQARRDRIVASYRLQAVTGQLSLAALVQAAAGAGASQ